MPTDTERQVSEYERGVIRVACEQARRAPPAWRCPVCLSMNESTTQCTNCGRPPFARLGAL